MEYSGSRIKAAADPVGARTMKRYEGIF